MLSLYDKELWFMPASVPANRAMASGDMAESLKKVCEKTPLERQVKLKGR